MGERSGRLTPPSTDWAGRIEQIIDSVLDRLEKSDHKEIKIPEVIKLMELHAKIAGKGGRNRAFWRFIEDIRCGRITCDKNGEEATDSGKMETGGETDVEVAGASVGVDD